MQRTLSGGNDSTLHAILLQTDATRQTGKPPPTIKVSNFIFIHFIPFHKLHHISTGYIRFRAAPRPMPQDTIPFQRSFRNEAKSSFAFWEQLCASPSNPAARQAQSSPDTYPCRHVCGGAGLSGVVHIKFVHGIVLLHLRSHPHIRKPGCYRTCFPMQSWQ